MTSHWARRNAAGKQRQDLIWAWTFVAVSTAGTMAAFVYASFMQSSREVGIVGGLITGPMALLGLYMVWRMARITADDAKFGVVSLTPASRLTTPGGEFKAVLRFHDRKPGLPEISAELRCLRVTLDRRSRRGIDSIEELVWSARASIPLRHDRAEILFDIPGDAAATDLPGERRGESGWHSLPVEAGKPLRFHRWEVLVTADVPGLDLERNFPVVIEPARKMRDQSLPEQR